MIKRLYILLIMLFLVSGFRQVQAQGIALKTNLAGWVAFGANIGAEFAVSECSSVETVFYQSITNSWNKDAKFTAIQFGYKYWFSRTPMNSFFLGATVTPARYKAVINDTNRKGYAFPFGVNCGYCLPLGERLNIEFCYGIGATYLSEEVTGRSEEFEFEPWTRHNLSFTPTNIGINVSYIIK